MAKTRAPLTHLQTNLIDEFGNLYETYGLKRLKGLIVGLLLTQSDPVSLDDMVELLGRSKGPISSAVRELATIGLVRKVQGPVNRRDYYVVHHDLFHNNFKFNMATVRKNRTIAARYLKVMKTADDADYREAIANLEHMEAFYTLMEAFYEQFSAAWEQKKRELD